MLVALGLEDKERQTVPRLIALVIMNRIFARWFFVSSDK